MKICANCGAQLPDDAAFCNNCGSALTENNNNTESAAPAADNAAPAEQPAQAPAPAPVPVPAPAPQPNAQQNYQQNFNQASYQQPQYQQPYVAYDPKDHTNEFDPQDIADNKLFAVLPYLFSCIVGIFVGMYVKDSAFVKFHLKNAIRLDIATVLTIILCVVPFIGWIAAIVCGLILEVVEIIAIVWVFQGKAKELPIISSIGFLK